MRRRVLPLGAGIWALGYVSVYVWIIRSQNDSEIAWWYVALIILGAGFSFAAATEGRRWASVSALLVLSVAALLGLLSIGLLLLPVVAGLLFVVGSPRAQRA